MDVTQCWTYLLNARLMADLSSSGGLLSGAPVQWTTTAAAQQSLATATITGELAVDQGDATILKPLIASTILYSSESCLSYQSHLIMVTLRNRAGHYILPCDFYLLLSIYLFSSPNLSGRRLDVYHTSTHCVALVRI